MLDDDGSGPTTTALWFLQYLAWRPDAWSFTGAELAGRLARAGFAPTPATEVVPETTKVVLARKRRSRHEHATGGDRRHPDGDPPRGGAAARHPGRGARLHRVQRRRGLGATTRACCSPRSRRARRGSSSAPACSTCGAAARRASRCWRRGSRRCPAAGSRSASARAARSSPKACTTCRSGRRCARLGAVARQVRGCSTGERLTAVGGRARPAAGRAAVVPVPLHLAALGPAGDAPGGRGRRRLVSVPACRCPGSRQGMCLLEEGAARGRPAAAAGHARPPDGAVGREVAAWWVVFYLTSMGPLYAATLRERGFGDGRGRGGGGQRARRAADGAARGAGAGRRAAAQRRQGAWSAGTPRAPTCRCWSCRRAGPWRSWSTPCARSSGDPPSASRSTSSTRWRSCAPMRRATSLPVDAGFLQKCSPPPARNGGTRSRVTSSTAAASSGAIPTTSGWCWTRRCWRSRPGIGVDEASDATPEGVITEIWESHLSSVPGARPLRRPGARSWPPAAPPCSPAAPPPGRAASTSTRRSQCTATASPSRHAVPLDRPGVGSPRPSCGAVPGQPGRRDRRAGRGPPPCPSGCGSGPARTAAAGPRPSSRDHG